MTVYPSAHWGGPGARREVRRERRGNQGLGRCSLREFVVRVASTVVIGSQLSFNGRSQDSLMFISISPSGFICK